MILTDAPVHLLNSPIQMVQSIEESNYGVQRGEIAPPSIIEHINDLSSHLEDVFTIISKDMKRVEAHRYWKKIKPIVIRFFEVQDQFNQEYDTGDYSKSVVAFQRMFAAVQSIISEVIFVANRKEINDDELDQYLHYLAKDNTLNKGVKGKKNVLALFD